jgi:Zn-dependent peptidase ImmA (M78 family)
MDFKKYTYAQLKEISESFLEKNNFRKGIIPTDIEMLIEKSGIIIETIDNLRKDFSVKGLVSKDVKDDGRIKIFIDTRHYEEDAFEYKFTLAEELSHILLHMDFYEGINDIEDYIKKYKSIEDDDYKKYEQQARNLASFLLLPEKEFNEEIISFIDTNIEDYKIFNFQSPENFSNKLSNLISKKFELSHHVIYRTIVSRYPNRIVDIIVDKYTGILKI